jgi:tryptophan synthase beta subunit
MTTISGRELNQLLRDYAGRRTVVSYRAISTRWQAQIYLKREIFAHWRA